jgi:serine/threonine protein kinase
MTRRIEPTFRALATAGLNLSHNYLLLHSQGLCYRDISFGNAFFDPDNGDVLIADNDNVSVDGAGALGVLGTPRFMAPEVVRGDALPSTQTDLFSLSVLIFYMLMVAHPLEGEKEASKSPTSKKNRQSKRRLQAIRLRLSARFMKSRAARWIFLKPTKICESRKLLTKAAIGVRI